MSLLWWLAFSGVRQGVSKLLQAVYTKPRQLHLLPCYRSFEVKFWFPQFGGGDGDPYGVGLRGVRYCISNFLRTALQSHQVSVMVSCAVFNLIFLTAPILGEEVPLRGRR